ncbi:hypothetical protein WJX84_001210 [Apatococcus fuscideae]|uniref:Peptidase S49 domain-containing protein n=1 Tax=Apatococcus fuscideae TaxID=2026836 RepID=A0AAW1TL31_9CHLO
MNRLSRIWSLGRHHTSPVVNVVKLQGIISPSDGVRGPAASRLLNLDRAEKWLTKAFDKRLSPVAVALCINSPGGAPGQTEQLFRFIRSLAERSPNIPVFSFIEDVAASGGYWLACAGDKIYGLETSLVGSIGVIAPSFGAVELIKKLGIERRVHTAGEAKAMLDPFRPEQPAEVERLEELLQGLHSSFKGAILDRRRATLDQNSPDLFSGRAWTGQQGLQLGLIDGIQDMHTFMREKFGPHTRFMLCSERRSTGLAALLGGRMLLGGGGIEAAAYASAAGFAKALADEATARTMLARYGL